MAKSQTNMGLLFSALDDHAAAVAVYREALGTYQRLGNRELAAATLLNLGMAHHLMDERPRRSSITGRRWRSVRATTGT
ncbi:MAG: tetratricopeptide repeat protein [Caldilineaceae bacterium]